MQNDSNLQNVSAKTSASNAVLTPELIHPNFFNIEHRKRWANRQLSKLVHNPSTAVLGA